MPIPDDVKRSIDNGDFYEFAKQVEDGLLPEPTDHQQNTDIKLLASSGVSGYVYTNNGVSGHWAPSSMLLGTSGYSGLSGYSGINISPEKITIDNVTAEVYKEERIDIGGSGYYFGELEFKSPDYPSLEFKVNNTDSGYSGFRWSHIALFVDNIKKFGISCTNDDSIGTYLGTVVNSPIHILTNGSEKMTLLADGKVGIGLATPQVTLDVNGFGCDKLAHMVRSYPDPDWGTIFPTLPDGHGLEMMSWSVSGVYYNALAGWNAGGYAYEDLYIDGSKILINTGATTGAVAGNVGIGPNSAGVPDLLTVRKDQDADTIVSVDNKNNAGRRVFQIKQEGTVVGEWGGSTNISESFLGTVGALDMRFITDNTTRVFIKSDGLVGIGTSLPYSQLQVSDPNSPESFSAGTLPDNTQVHITGALTVPTLGVDNIYGRILLSSDKNRDYGTYWATRRDASANMYQVLGVRQAGVNLDVITIDNTGKVGIGTTTPIGNFEVAGSDFILTNILKTTNASGYAVFDLYRDTTRFGYYGCGPDFVGVGSVANVPFQIATNNTAKVTVLADGKVGIGTATPTSILSVVGLPSYANNAAAITGGLVAGDLYRTGGDPDLVAVVH